MILIEENPNSHPVLQIFGRQYHKSYLGCYYRNKKAKEKNQKSWFTYITSIFRCHDGSIEINGSNGTKRYSWYPMREAITLYNKECRKRFM